MSSKEDSQNVSTAIAEMDSVVIISIHLTNAVIFNEVGTTPIAESKQI